MAAVELRPIASIAGGFLAESLAEDWEAVFPKVRESGFVGVEWAPVFVKDLPKLRAALQRHGLEIVAQIHTGDNPCTTRDVERHKAHLRELVTLVDHGVVGRPHVL